jgi:alpha-beta hydrolase superfamily lysophospholipase
LADITSHLNPNAISGAILSNPMPYLDPAVVTAVAKPEILDLIPGLSTTDDVALAFESRFKFIDTLFINPERVPVQTKWAWMASAALPKPQTFGLMISRPQDPTGLFKAGKDGLPLLLFTSGKDRHLRAEAEQDIARTHFTDLTVLHIEEGSHTLFYDFNDKYVGGIIEFGKRVFG